MTRRIAPRIKGPFDLCPLLADLIRTVAVAPTIENVGVLGLIVLIRTFLSFSLEIEIEGVPPWRRALVNGTSRIARGCQPGPRRHGR